jgi:hypothetical protein
MARAVQRSRRRCTYNLADDLLSKSEGTQVDFVWGGVG